MNTPSNLKYTKTDEWFDPATGALGLTDYAHPALSMFCGGQPRPRHFAAKGGRLNESPLRRDLPPWWRLAQVTALSETETLNSSLRVADYKVVPGTRNSGRRPRGIADRSH
jgi:hypothetical protein